ncbi:MAG TPA: hypothetical protein VKU36_05190 [Candidatus Babeliales bacterium]|nr:hypothetical protein [Candidatus Babeliales bacterium]
MKPPVEPVEYYYFLEEALTELDKSILKSSEESVDRLLQQIYIDARIETIDISDIQELITTTDQLEIAMLTELLMYVQEKKEYYDNKQRESYDFSALKPAALFFIVLLILIGLLYCFHTYYHVAKKKEMLDLIEKLKPYGVTIKECSRNVYRNTEYWLEMDDSEFLAKMGILNNSLSAGQLSAEQYDRARKMIDLMDNMINQIYKIHATLRGTFRWIFIIIGSGAFFVMSIIYSYLQQWYNPQYKERYEKFTWLETKIQQRIDTINDNIAIF